ncbi:MAG: cation diffusion facilitator family transporter [Carbonactinosporaceae bacterium]
MSTGGGKKAIVAALAANLGIAVSKFVAFLLSGSASMLAESLHSVADSGNQGLLLLGGRRARRSATAEHPFGYGRDRYFYAFVVSVVLFTLGGLFALYEGYEKIRHPHELAEWYWPIGVLLVAIVMESFSLRTAVIESNQVRGSQSWVEFVRRAKAPELPVVLLEDLAALIGLMLALAGVSLAALTGNPLWDGVGSMSIGALLVVIAVILAAETKSMLIGEAATRSDIAKIEAALRAEPGVRRIIHMRTMHLGPDELLVAAKFAIRRWDSAADVANTINTAEGRIREAVPIARVIYLEPDFQEMERADADVEAAGPLTRSD